MSRFLGMKDAGEKSAQVAWGILLALGVAVCAYGLMRVCFYFFPSLIVGRVPWVAWLLMIVLPEAIFIAFAVTQWRKRRPMAVGVLIPAAMLAVHFAMHVVSHFSQ